MSAASNPVGSPSSAGREFVRGLCTPSWAALAGTFVVAGICLLLCALLLTQRFMASPLARYLPRDRHDEFALLTMQTLRLRMHAKARPLLAVLGDSTLREALTDDADLNKRLAESLGPGAPAAAILSGAALRFDEMEAIVDNLRLRPGSVVVIETALYSWADNGRNLRDHAKYPRLALDSPAWEAELVHAGIHVHALRGCYFFRHLNFFLARIDSVWNIFHTPPRLRAHMTKRLDWRDHEEKWDITAARMQDWVRDYPRRANANRAILHRLVALARRQPGVSVMLLEGVRNPRTDRMLAAMPGGQAVLDAYGRDVRQFAVDNRIQYMDLYSAANLQYDDFADYAHIQSEAARGRFTAALVAGVAGVLPAPATRPATTQAVHTPPEVHP